MSVLNIFLTNDFRFSIRLSDIRFNFYVIEALNRTSKERILI